MTLEACAMSSNRHNQFTGTQRPAIHNPLRPVQSRTTDLCRSSLIHMTVIERHQPAPPPHDLHLRYPSRHARLPGRTAARLPAPHRVRASLPGRRHRRRLAAASAAGSGRRATTTWCRRSCARRARAPTSSISRATTTRPRATTASSLRRHAGRRTRRSTRPPTAAAPGHPWRRVRRHRALRALARPPGRLGLHAALRINTGFNRAPPQLGLPYWSLSAYLKHKVKNAVQFIDNFEHAVAERGAPPRRRRRGVRPHPPGRDPHDRRRALLQRRRLGRELHRPGRALRRPAAHRRTGPRNTRAAMRCCRASRRRAGGGVAGLRIAIVTDAWRPQINGVVRTIETVAAAAAGRRATTSRCSAPTASAPCPARPIPRSACRCFPAARLAHMLKLYAPDAHPSRDRGAAGLGGARLLPGSATFPSPPPITRAFPNMCAPASACRSPGATPSCAASMRPRRRCWWWRSRSATSSAQRGFRNLVPWSRGVDIAAFRPHPRKRARDRPADLALCRAAWPSRRTSRLSSISTCPAPSGWWAAARSSRN